MGWRVCFERSQRKGVLPAVIGPSNHYRPSIRRTNQDRRFVLRRSVDRLPIAHAAALRRIGAAHDPRLVTLKTCAASPRFGPPVNWEIESCGPDANPASSSPLGAPCSPTLGKEGASDWRLSIALVGPACLLSTPPQELELVLGLSCPRVPSEREGVHRTGAIERPTLTQVELRRPTGFK